MKFKNALLLVFITFLSVQVTAQKYLSKDHKEVTAAWKDNDFTSSKTILENIEEAPQFTILSGILKNKALQQTLDKEEMITVFAMTDAAFMELPKKSRDSILGNSKLTEAMIKYLSVPGRLDSYSLKAALKKNNGSVFLATLAGEKLEVKEVNGVLQLIDSEKRTARIIASDFYHKNGFFHIVEGLVFPHSEE
ncbi:fasciclin domain-containing protein [Aequorivita marina]|uniref:fasciclin domain-containing protein n=1 Tax=Aequorivita marina TaxID=3073654 RepID=UPI0028761017|nr:fasciclin domain-containing protein [Aequorivita sp. S2608]MDS1299355.1 fasciclin domain-containing protein [Aequorivita sp. S2608]